MKASGRKVTFEVAMTLAHHREQLGQKCTAIQHMLAGRKQVLLPEGWTDEDAWELAGTLAEYMGQMHRVQHTMFGKDNPYPDEEALLEDIPYYNPYGNPEDPTVPPELPIGRWKAVLHCGILIAAANPAFCFPSEGTFGDLEELFRGVSRAGDGPRLKFGYVLDQLWSALSEDRARELEKLDFGPVPPSFDPPKDSTEKWHQDQVRMMWEEWDWPSRFPHKDDLYQAIADFQYSKNLYQKAMDFISLEIGMNDGLRQAIDLYLHQTGLSGMAEDSYYVTYAMLCRTQKQMEKALAAQQEETEG